MILAKKMMLFIKKVNLPIDSFFSISEPNFPLSDKTLSMLNQSYKFPTMNIYKQTLMSL